MSMTTFTGYASTKKALSPSTVTFLKEAINRDHLQLFKLEDNVIVPRIEESNTHSAYNAYRYDILSSLAVILVSMADLEEKFAGEFNLSTYTIDKNGNTWEVSQIIEVIDSVAYPTLKINPDSSSFTSRVPVYTQEDVDKMLKQETEVNYNMGYDEGFSVGFEEGVVEGATEARMDDDDSDNPFLN